MLIVCRECHNRFEQLLQFHHHLAVFLNRWLRCSNPCQTRTTFPQTFAGRALAPIRHAAEIIKMHPRRISPHYRADRAPHVSFTCNRNVARFAVHERAPRDLGDREVLPRRRRGGRTVSCSFALTSSTHSSTARDASRDVIGQRSGVSPIARPDIVGHRSARLKASRRSLAHIMGHRSARLKASRRSLAHASMGTHPVHLCFPDCLISKRVLS